MQKIIHSSRGFPKKYSPDVILNRFDLRYNENNYYMHISTNNEKFEVGFHIEDTHCMLGILNVTIEVEIFKQIIQYLFETYPTIERISFQTMICDPIKLGFNVKCHKHRFWSLKLPNTYDELLERESVKFLRKMRYEIKYLINEVGAFSVENYYVNEIPSTIMEMFFSWKEIKYPDSFLEHNAIKYLYRDRRPVSDAYVLKVSERVIAVLFTSEQCEITYLVNTAFDPQFARYSVGRLLYYELLRQLIDKNTKEIYLGTGKYDYKKSFGATELECWIGDFFREKIH